MTTELVKSIDAIKNKVISLEKELQLKIDENVLITKKNEDLQDELENLNKVSILKFVKGYCPEEAHIQKKQR